MSENKAELIYKWFDEENLVIGFICHLCEENNLFNGEDSDYLRTFNLSGFGGQVLHCGCCEKEVTLEEY